MPNPPSRPESPGAPWWLIPLLVVLAILGAIYLVRIVLGFIFASVGLIIVIGLIVLSVMWFARSRS